ncbi:SDR family NAD(P)-dependent oxidoreductase [Prauserella muralis]|uniref:2,5-dichloro-2,5-cyclohexadiene-1,4-diol dehydrogenase n=1 Tax=Prauserella muralis TaxID=588067 RepID=A0A2V4AGA3_9PSEU|nr:SDR family oxidoreductase [Prauserella muralis]PXY18962.1 2,5-dichloro-2,5-cyclohexadiene-1,4-diol dehydrogenase [Prauserella muralis]TWE28847.1 NAD(P)-dependent dehydrogenase (short-subunit alcohol dehydrogenase family) [Prauserella muralis]
MRISLEGKAALVTGASSGLGAGIAAGLASAGAEVMLVGRDRERLEKTRDAVEAAGGRGVVRIADVCAPESATSIVDAAISELGALDVLVNAAGLFEVGCDDETHALDRQWAVNVRAPFAMTTAALPRMRQGGAVCFFSSIAGHVAFPGASAYVTTKTAVEGAVRALALDAAPLGLRVNAVAPGNIRTPMNAHLLTEPSYEQSMLDQTPLGRIGEVEDVVPAVVFLVSDHARYITGSSLLVDGGWTAR